MILSKNNFAAEIILTREECIKEAKRLLPDLILIGTKAGAVDAMEEFAKVIKETPGLNNIPIIIYDDVGAVSNRRLADTGKKGFVWNDEGERLLQRIREVLNCK